MKNINWAKIKTEYVNTSINKTALARKFGISRNALISHIKNEDWDVEKEERLRKTGEKMSEKFAEIQIKQGVEKLKSLIDSGDKLCKALNERINKALVDEEELSSKELKDLVTAYKDLIPSIRSVNNILTLQELEAIKIAIEKLQLERERTKREEVEAQEVRIEFKDEGQSYGE